LNVVRNIPNIDCRGPEVIFLSGCHITDGRCACLPPHGEGMSLKQMCLQSEHDVWLCAQLQMNHMRYFCMRFSTTAW